jgi:hypothetical protein
MLVGGRRRIAGARRVASAAENSRRAGGLEYRLLIKQHLEQFKTTTIRPKLSAAGCVR